VSSTPDGHGIGTERNSERHGLPRFSVQLLLGPLQRGESIPILMKESLIENFLVRSQYASGGHIASPEGG
jgi:hypothetical protein